MRAQRLGRRLGASRRARWPGAGASRHNPRAMLVPVRGVRLGVVDVGRGRPVVLLHGLGGRASNWEPQIEALRDRYRVVALDLRGFGRSDPADGPLGLADHAADVAALVDHLGLAGCAVVGLSMGGMVAQELVLRHPGAVAALALADTTARLSDRAKEFNRRLAKTALEEGMDATTALMLPGCFTPASIAAGRACVRAFGDSLRATDPRSFATALEAIEGLDTLPRLGAIAVPTLVLAGEHDGLLPDCELIARSIPGARLAVIPGAGHVASMEEPEAFTAALRAFLDALPGR
jgi:3-oxoadipate enol-lactonase